MRTLGTKAGWTMSGMRLTFAGGFIAPGIAARVLAIEPTPQSAYLVRLVAARNVAMTAGLWMSRGRARRLWWTTGVACDALDAVAGLLALREGKPRSAALIDVGAACTAMTLGMAGLLAEREEAR